MLKIDRSRSKYRYDFDRYTNTVTKVRTPVTKNRTPQPASSFHVTQVDSPNGGHLTSRPEENC